MQRQATVADLRDMWAVRTAAIRQTCATHYTDDVIATLAESAPPSSMAPLIEAGGAFVVGDEVSIFGYGVIDIETGEIDALFVAPEWQGRAIARQLMVALETTALNNHLERIFLSSSLNAVAFYKSVGFRSVREEVYPHRSGIGIPAILMEKDLSALRVPIHTGSTLRR